MSAFCATALTLPVTHSWIEPAYLEQSLLSCGWGCYVVFSPCQRGKCVIPAHRWLNSEWGGESRLMEIIVYFTSHLFFLSLSYRFVKTYSVIHYGYIYSYKSLLFEILQNAKLKDLHQRMCEAVWSQMQLFCFPASQWLHRQHVCMKEPPRETASDRLP